MEIAIEKCGKAGLWQGEWDLDKTVAEEASFVGGWARDWREENS